MVYITTNGFGSQFTLIIITSDEYTGRILNKQGDRERSGLEMWLVGNGEVIVVFLVKEKIEALSLYNNSAGPSRSCTGSYAAMHGH